MKKKYKLKLSVESCEDLKDRLLATAREYKKDFIAVYLENCLEWIKKESIKKLDKTDFFHPSFISDIRNNIDIIPLNTKYKKYALVYYSDIVAWVEFGTGVIGKTSPHPLANKINYNYASGKHSSSGKGRWSWYNADYASGMNEYTGYTGKRFIYETIQDFLNMHIGERIYSIMLNKVLNYYF